LGYAYYIQKGSVSNAERYLMKAIEFVPDRSAAWFNLGELYAEQGNIDLAVACFAHTFRFSKNRLKTAAFFQNQIEIKENPNVKRALKETIQLKLFQQY